MKLLTLEEAVYCAAFIDGEGSFQVFKRQHKSQGYTYTGYSASIDIVNTDLAILEWFKSLFGGCINKKTVRKENWKQGYNWRLGGQDSQVLIRQCLPYFRVKQKQADLFNRFPFGTWKQRELKEQLYWDMKALNKRGV